MHFKVQNDLYAHSTISAMTGARRDTGLQNQAAQALKPGDPQPWIRYRIILKDS
jgi:hypothetical protein